MRQRNLKLSRSRLQLAEQIVRRRFQLRDHIFKRRLLCLGKRELRGNSRKVRLHQVGLRRGQLRLLLVTALDAALICVIELSMVTRCCET